MPSKPKTAEDRVKEAHSKYACSMSSSLNPIDSFAEFKAGWEAAVRECYAAVRELCAECDEDGICGEEEGTSIECMYCGVPIRNIREKTGVKP